MNKVEKYEKEGALVILISYVLTPICILIITYKLLHPYHIIVSTILYMLSWFLLVYGLHLEGEGLYKHYRYKLHKLMRKLHGN